MLLKIYPDYKKINKNQVPTNCIWKVKLTTSWIMKLLVLFLASCQVVQGKQRLQYFHNHHNSYNRNNLKARIGQKLGEQNHGRERILGRMCSFPSCFECTKIYHDFTAALQQSGIKQRYCKLMLDLPACCETTNMLYNGFLKK